MKYSASILALCVALCASTAYPQTFKTLLAFTGSGGAASGDIPLGSLTTNGTNGTTLYGMTEYGGASREGNIFSVDTNYQNLVSFTGTGGMASGAFPRGSLTIANTTLYGMTSEGGASGDGNVFSVGADGTNFENLVSFTGGTGTATGGGQGDSLTLVGTGLYGMTDIGGAGGYGNVFGVGTNGTSYQNTLSFTGTAGTASGSDPFGSLILAGTTLYGMTQLGGADGYGNIFSVGIDGSDYQDLYSFTGGTDGGYPEGELTLLGGTLFGMTSGLSPGGFNIDDGTVFALTLPTPEPGTLALAGSTAAVLVAYGWRRRRRRSEAAAGGTRSTVEHGHCDLRTPAPAQFREPRTCGRLPVDASW
jgi:uncharacterized repeat protein (TIGR03803 family)